MKTLCTCLVFLGLGSVWLPVWGAEPTPLNPHLEPLRPWLGRTWKGEFSSSTPKKPVIDVARWESALNGQAVRILHAINEGVYGGESIIRWDEVKRTLAYHYFTTADFMTIGTLTVEDGKLLTHETVSGKAGGVTEVRSTIQMRPDGTYLIRTQQCKDGVWGPGRETVYREASGASVVFREVR